MNANDYSGSDYDDSDYEEERDRRAFSALTYTGPPSHSRRMTTHIQKPTKGRVVLYTAFRGHVQDKEQVDEYAGIVTGVPDPTRPEIINIVTFGDASTYFQTKVPFNADGLAGTWRYPPRSEEMVEV